MIFYPFSLSLTQLFPFISLIALMLGRLRMSIEDCEKAYDNISKRIFGEKAGYVIKTPEAAFAAGSYIYNSKPLEDAVKELVVKYLPGSSPDEKLQDVNNTPEADQCKV